METPIKSRRKERSREGRKEGGRRCAAFSLRGSGGGMNGSGGGRCCVRNLALLPEPFFEVGTL